MQARSLLEGIGLFLLIILRRNDDHLSRIHSRF
jgi:hypothetical protein